MTWSKFFTAVSVLGFVMGIVFLFRQTHVIDWEDHERYSRDLVRMDGVNADLNKNILKVRYHWIESDDVLVSQMGRLKHLQESLAHIPRCHWGPRGSGTAPAV